MLVIIDIILTIIAVGLFIAVVIRRKQNKNIFNMTALARMYIKSSLTPAECKQEKDRCLQYQQNNCTDKNVAGCDSAICDQVEAVCNAPERHTGWS